MGKRGIRTDVGGKKLNTKHREGRDKAHPATPHGFFRHRKRTFDFCGGFMVGSPASL